MVARLLGLAELAGAGRRGRCAGHRHLPHSHGADAGCAGGWRDEGWGWRWRLAALMLGAAQPVRGTGDGQPVIQRSRWISPIRTSQPSQWTLTLHPDGSGHFRSQMGKPPDDGLQEIDAPAVDRDIQVSADFTPARLCGSPAPELVQRGVRKPSEGRLSGLENAQLYGAGRHTAPAPSTTPKTRRFRRWATRWSGGGDDSGRCAAGDAAAARPPGTGRGDGIPGGSRWRTGGRSRFASIRGDSGAAGAGRRSDGTGEESGPDASEAGRRSENDRSGPGINFGISDFFPLAACPIYCWAADERDGVAAGRRKAGQP